MILPTRNERRTLAARRPSFGTILRSPWSRRLRPPLTAVVSCPFVVVESVAGAGETRRSSRSNVPFDTAAVNDTVVVGSNPDGGGGRGGSTTRGKTNDGEKEKNVVSHDRRYSTSRRYTDIDRFIARCEPLDRWL